MKRILISVMTVALVAGAAFAASGAFFSDTETSTGNVLAAGSIDLGLDNESFYNGELNPGTSWSLSFDLDDGQGPASGGAYLFFDFDDVKPGDYGEDTISIHVDNNESWLCADVTLTSNDDNDCTEPENDVDSENGACVEGGGNDDGDLAQQINFLWWADDGDNVLEDDEQTLPAGALGSLGVGNTATVTLADSGNNIWTDLSDDPILTDDPGDLLYVGKAWCFGPISEAPVPQDGVGDAMTPAGDNEGVDNVGNGTPGEPTDGGYTCDGENIGNEAQTDSATLDVAFRAEQARNNDSFLCQPE